MQQTARKGFSTLSVQNLFCSESIHPLFIATYSCSRSRGTEAPSHGHLVRVIHFLLSCHSHTYGGGLSFQPIVHISGLWKETEGPWGKLAQTQGEPEISMQNLCSTNHSTTLLPLPTI